MSLEIKKLAKETALYSISSIAGKFMNWMMVPLYTYVLADSADYGIVTNLYSWTAVLLVILTYGMETGFLRFVNSHENENDTVYSTTLISLGISSITFAILIFILKQPVANMLGYATHAEFIALLGCVVAMDAFCSIPLVYLRYKGRSIRFVVVNMLGILIKIVLNLFFLVVCPWLQKSAPELISWFYKPDYGVGYVFIANFISTALICLILFQDIFVVAFRFNATLLKQMLKYSLPLILLGIAGIMNQTFDKILFPFLIPGEAGRAELGIYGATSKVAMVIMMFSQAFFYAYEPYIFAKKRDKSSMEAYADSMKFYIIVALMVFLGMVLYMDILKYIIREDYWDGLNVVPIVMISYLFQGIYFNLSIWYKLTDKTYYGAWFSILGAIIIVFGNVVLVPLYSYHGAAWAAVLCYLCIMLLSYFSGQKMMPVNYDLKSIGFYSLLTIILFGVSLFIKTPWFIVNILLKTALMAVFLVLLVKRDVPLKTIPFLQNFYRKQS